MTATRMHALILGNRYRRSCHLCMPRSFALRVLAGCWEARSGGRRRRKSSGQCQRRAGRHRMSISMGRTVHEDTLVDFEQVVLREKNGRLEYEMHPANQSIGVFLSTQITPTNLVFENPRSPTFPSGSGTRCAECRFC